MISHTPQNRIPSPAASRIKMCIRDSIKKENIGLIEVMGLAVLPSRLKQELFDLADMLEIGRAHV